MIALVVAHPGSVLRSFARALAQAGRAATWAIDCVAVFHDWESGARPSHCDVEAWTAHICDGRAFMVAADVGGGSWRDSRPEDSGGPRSCDMPLGRPDLSVAQAQRVDDDNWRARCGLRFFVEAVASARIACLVTPDRCAHGRGGDFWDIPEVRRIAALPTADEVFCPAWKVAERKVRAGRLLAARLPSLAADVDEAIRRKPLPSSDAPASGILSDVVATAAIKAVQQGRLRRYCQSGGDDHLALDADGFSCLRAAATEECAGPVVGGRGQEVRQLRGDLSPQERRGP